MRAIVSTTLPFAFIKVWLFSSGAAQRFAEEVIATQRWCYENGSWYYKEGNAGTIYKCFTQAYIFQGGGCCCHRASRPFFETTFLASLVLTFVPY